MGNLANLIEEIRKTKKKLAISYEVIHQAHASFTSHYSAVLSLSEQLDTKLKEIEIRETAVEIKEKEIRDKRHQVQKRKRRCSEREQALDMREKEVTMKEQRWIETELTMKQNANKMLSIIQFNVSGKRFALSKEQILRLNGSLLQQMIVSNNPPVLNSEIFIQRNPKYARYVFGFVMEQDLPLPSSTTKLVAIENEFKFFKIPFKPPQLINETIGEHKSLVVLQEWLPNTSLHIIYKATIDGFRAIDFHTHCDNKGPTLTLIRSDNGYLFGGYSRISWDSNNNYKQSDNAEDTFIFTLTNPHSIPPTKYHCHHQHHAIYAGLNHGPDFGGGSDLCVSDDSHHQNSSYTHFPTSYTDTTGKGNNTFTGTYNFTTLEIEVYSVRVYV